MTLHSRYCNRLCSLQYLEWREKQYDVRHHAQVFSKENTAQPLLPLALVYIASADRSMNRNWLGPAEPEQIARQIATAHGPSGPNSEYLFRLVGALRQVLLHKLKLFWST